jgi:hypothetical protein
MVDILFFQVNWKSQKQQTTNIKPQPNRNKTRTYKDSINKTMITNKYKILKMPNISQPKYATAKSDTSNPSHTESPSDQPTNKMNWKTQNSCVIAQHLYNTAIQYLLYSRAWWITEAALCTQLNSMHLLHSSHNLNDVFPCCINQWLTKNDVRFRNPVFNMLIFKLNDAIYSCCWVVYAIIRPITICIKIYAKHLLLINISWPKKDIRFINP